MTYQYLKDPEGPIRSEAMALHRVTANSLVPVQKVGLAESGLREREDLQRLLKENIEIISPDTLVIAEEFSEWEDSRRRIDLLGIDKDGNLVVIELKRTDDGGHMELQAIRYAAMVSALTLERIVEVYGKYLASRGEKADPMALILAHIGLDSPDEAEVAENVRIVLASADFSKEITTSVLWLNDQGLDITCVKLSGYREGEELIIDVQQLVPLKEAGEYTVQLKEKRQRVRADRKGAEREKFNVHCGDQEFSGLARRQAVFTIVKHLADQGISPVDLQAAIAQKSRRFYRVPSEVRTEADFLAQADGAADANDGMIFAPTQWFTADQELIHHAGKTYAFSKRWGPHAAKVMTRLLEAYGDRGIGFTKV